MALKFLSKKKWHVRRLENIRKVAEAEAKLAEEQTRMAELRREREEEREFENIRKIQEASGRIPKQQPRLEFLYKTPPVKKQSEEDIITSKDILAGRRPDSILFNKLDKKRVEYGLPGVKWVYSLQPGKSDSNLKLREDPITGIIAKRKKARQEQEERENMLKKLQQARNQQIPNVRNRNGNISNFSNRNTSDISINNDFQDKETSNENDNNDNDTSLPPDDSVINNNINSDFHKPQDHNDEIDEESLRITLQMEEFERKQKKEIERNYDGSSDYSDGYERRRRKHRSHHHHRHHHHPHHRHHHRSSSSYSDYD